MSVIYKIKKKLDRVGPLITDPPPMSFTTLAVIFFWGGGSKFFLVRGKKNGRGRTNDRPGTDHVTSGPMRGLKKKCTRWRTYPHNPTQRTWRLNDWIGPVGPIQWKGQQINLRLSQFNKRGEGRWFDGSEEVWSWSQIQWQICLSASLHTASW